MLHTGHLAAGLRWPHAGPPLLPLDEGERAELFLMRLFESEGLPTLRFLPVMTPSIDDRLAVELTCNKFVSGILALDHWRRREISC